MRAILHTTHLYKHIQWSWISWMHAFSLVHELASLLARRLSMSLSRTCPSCALFFLSLWNNNYLLPLLLSLQLPSAKMPARTASSRDTKGTSEAPSLLLEHSLPSFRSELRMGSRLGFHLRSGEVKLEQN